MKPTESVPDRLARIQESIDVLMKALQRQKNALDAIRDDLAAYRNDVEATPNRNDRDR